MDSKEPSIIQEAERILKLLKNEEEVVSQEGANRLIEFVYETTEKGKAQYGKYQIQYGGWLLERQLAYERYRDKDNTASNLYPVFDSLRADIAEKFVQAYRWGKTYHCFEIGETKRLKAENEAIAAKLAKRERELNEKEAEVGRLESRVRFLEEALTKNGISFGGMQSDVP